MKLTLQDVSVRFGGFKAVDGVSLSIEPGTLVGIIGQTGPENRPCSRRSPAFSRMAKAGSRWVRRISRARPRSIARGRAWCAPSSAARIRHLTVRENLMAAAPGQSGENLFDLFFRPGKVRAEEASIRREVEDTIDFLKLRAVADTSAGRLSGGQKKLLELGRVLMTKPKLILLDEPFAGVNPVLIEELSGHIRALNQRGIGFVIIEHDLSALSRL